MLFNNKQLPYRIALNTQTQQFMAFDAKDASKVAYGNTIEKAIAALKQII